MGWSQVHIGIVSNSGDSWGCLSAAHVWRDGTYGGSALSGEGGTHRGVAFDASLYSNRYGDYTEVNPLYESVIFYIKY